MLEEITRKQTQKLESYLLDRKNHESLTVSDNILNIYLPVKKGIRKNGYNIYEIMEMLDYDIYDFKAVTKVRILVCQFAKELVKEGYAFGGLKTGKLKNYGWAIKNEWRELETTRDKRLLSELKAHRNYISDSTSKKYLLSSKLIGDIENGQTLLF